MSLPIPKLTRRSFIQVGTVGVAGYSLLPIVKPQNVQAAGKAQLRGGAEVCILFFLQGGPSQLDTFGAKEGPWTPKDFDILTVKSGLRMAAALLTKLSERAGKFSVIQSLASGEANY